MTEYFAQPDDTGELQASDLNTSLAQSLGARAGQAMGSGLGTLLRNKEYSEAESPQEGLESQIGRLQAGEDLGDVIAKPQSSKLIPPDDAQERVKQAGVTGIKLPAGDIREPVLDLMIKHAHEREQYDAATSRGPSGLIPGALGFATEVGAGMIDPINVAAFSIPIMGEARFGMMLARAGDSIAHRAMVRGGVTAAQGAVGSALLQPGEWWLHTRDGQDYTYADALRGVIMGAAMGAAFGAGHAALGDVRARAAGRPLAGSVDDLAARALAGDEQAAGILQATPEGRRVLAGEQPAPAAEAAPAAAAAPPATEEAPPGLTPAMETQVTINGETQTIRGATMVPEPEAVFMDLPARVREDTVRASMADAINGNLGRGGELLKEAAKEDPRIAESIAAGRESTIVNAAEFSEPARAVFTDMHAQLKTAGMSDDEAAANAAVVAARYEARAARLEGAGGTAEDLYRAEGIRVQRGGTEDELGRSFAQRRGPQYPLAPRSEWYGEANYETAGGHMVEMSPDEFLARSRPIKMDETTRENVDDLKRHMREGKTLDPLKLYEGGKEDGRHRAIAAKELGIDRVPVVTFRPGDREFFQRRRPLPGQSDLFGGVRATDAEMAQRGANEPLRPGVAQKPMDVGLFGDTAQQSDLVDTAKGRQLFQPATVPTFFSAVSRAIDSMRQEKASPEQWLATLRNTPGVKQEELQWLGLPDWLKEQKGSVTRHQIQDYVRANNIEVKEVAKGEQPPRVQAELDDISNRREAAQQEAFDLTYQFADDVRAAGLKEQNYPVTENMHEWKRPEGRAELKRAGLLPVYEKIQAAWDRVTEINRRRAEIQKESPEPDNPKFAPYTLPGGENYRELLLTLPRKPDREGPPIESGDTLDNFALRPGEPTVIRDAEFRGSHWDEPNVLAHVRFNDRTIGGTKTLFIEEVQSDWHQQGKRKGYKEANPEAEAAAAREMDKADTELRFAEQRHRLGRGYVGADMPPEIKQLYAPEAITDVQQALERFRAARENYAQYDMGSGRVPDAPFKTTWPELAFKRMIRYAAENGYEKIAWTPGEVQAERYDLSKHIKEIEYIKNPDGTYKLGIADKEGEPVGALPGMDVNRMTLAQIEEAVGKDIAEKISKEEGRRFRGHDGITLENVDLKVGGEGMAGFYDKILPATVNKLVKKYGTKVEDAKIQTEPDTVDVVSRGRGTLGLGRETFGVRDPNTGDVQGLFSTRAEAEASLDAIRDETRQAIHAIDLTEPLRKAATEEGFPLFQREPGGEMRGRITLADNKAIIDLFRSADKSTLMHEAGHLWLDEMARDAARENAPEGIRKDMETVLKWLGAERADAITEEQHEKWARGFETYLASGEAPTSALRAVFAQFKEWLSAIYKGIVGAGETITPEIRAVMDRMVATPEQLGELGEAPSADILPGPRAARGPRSRDPETFSLLEFLAARGGIRADDPLASDLRGSFGGKNKFVPGFGQLIRQPRELSTAQRMGGGRAPMTLDQAREAAVEAGYLRDTGEHTGGASETTVRTLLDAVDRETRGQRVYREGYEPKGKPEFDPDEEMHRLHSAIDDAVRDSGLDPVALSDKTRARILEIMTKEGERDPEIAYERAIMEETHYGTEQGRAEPIPDHVPGWDVPDVGRPAQAAGGPFEGLGRPGDAGAGAAPRGTGGNERQAPGAGANPAAARNGNGVAAAHPAPDWRGLVAAAKSDDADLIAPSRAATKEKPPESTDTPEKAVSAAELKAKEAEQLLADLLPRLTEEERTLMTDMLNAADRDRSEREQIVREGAACLAAGLVGTV